MWKIISAIIFVIGLGGIPDDIKTWNNWIGALDRKTIRWLFGIAGIIIFYMLTDDYKKLKTSLLSFLKGIVKQKDNGYKEKKFNPTFIIVFFSILIGVLYLFINNPFKETFSIILTPLTPNEEAKMQMSGSLTEGSDSVIPVIRIGDTQDNQEIRGFISFDLSDIPKNAEIDSAKLFFHVPPHTPQALIGDLNPNYFHTLILEIIDIGQGLDKEDFHAKKVIAVENNKIPFKNFQKRPYDVSKGINNIREDGRTILTFRLRFTERTDGNHRMDSLTMVMRECKTALVIEYK